MDRESVRTAVSKAVMSIAQMVPEVSRLQWQH